MTPGRHGGRASAPPIVLNGRVAARAEISGVERLAHELIRRLVAMRPDRYRVIAPPRGRTDRVAGQAWEQLALPAYAARQAAAIVYSPANLAPLLWPRNVVVLHDAMVWREPGSFSRGYVAWHRLAEAAAARRALRVITVSEFSRRELIDVLDLDPESIAVVPNGVDERFGTAADPEPARRRYSLQRPYVLTVATPAARKSLDVLAAVAAALSGDGIDTVWAGGGRPHMPADASGGAAVRALGFVPDEDLPGLYAGALAFVLPSRYEGFGITCLEAMACGTPVVAADRAALPETCGEAALLVDPDDEHGFAAAVADVVVDATLRERLRAAGLERVTRFTWAAAAAATDRLLVGAAEGVARRRG